MSVAGVGLVLALSLLLGACGGSGGHQTTTAALKAKGLQRRRDQVTWVTTLNGTLGRELAKLTVDHTTASGQWHLVFNAKNVNLTNPQQAPAAAGLLLTTARLGLSGGRMRFAADPICPHQGKATPGIYTYHVAGSRLTVTEVGHSDSCTLRAKALTSTTWTKGP